MGALFCGMVTLFIVTWVSPRAREAKARATIDRAEHGVEAYWKRTGRWPTSLNQVGSTNTLSFEGAAVQYDCTNLTVSLYVHIEKRSPIHILTFGLLGETRTDCSYGTDFRCVTNASVAEPVPEAPL